MLNEQYDQAAERLWKVSDVADFLQMSASWVYKQAEAGLLPVRRLGASLRFSQNDIRAYVAGTWRPPNTAGSVLARRR